MLNPGVSGTLSATASTTESTVVVQSKVLGSIQGQVRQLTVQEADDLQFVSHDKILTWEGIVENIGQSNATVHLIDTDVFEGHYGYTQKALGRGPSYRQENFFSDVQFPERRRYMPFLVFDFRDQPLVWQGQSYHWVLNIRRYNYSDTHQHLADMLVGLKELLSETLMQGFGEPLLFVYEQPGSFRRPHIDRTAEVKAAGFEVITEPQMIEAAGGALVSVLNPGIAIGHLRLIQVGESIEGLTPRHIAVFEDTPERIPPVTGIVTLEPQTPLSHVNLLAKNRGTPNVSTAKIDLIPNLEQLLGNLVRMEAKADGSVSFQAVSRAEAERFWNSRGQVQLEVPQIQATSLSPVEFAAAPATERALTHIGSKASNYAEIQQLLDPAFVRPGFALSFAHYQRIVSEPTTQALIQGLLVQKNVLTPEEINTQLKQIRQSIRSETSDANLTESLAAIRAVIAQMPATVTRIRLRSSTNSEDLPTFNGAGLYESAGFNVDDSDKKLKKKFLRVMASLWLERAFWERELFGIDHGAVGMAVLINPAFRDEFANGVVIGSQENGQFQTWVNAQKGEASVTNPLDGEIPESFTLTGNQVNELVVQSRSNIGAVFLEENQMAVRRELSEQLFQLQGLTQQLHEHFVTKQRASGDHRNYGIDIEYKLMQEGDKVNLYIKQSRLLNLGKETTPSTPSIAKVAAKDNGMGGAHLRRQPRQLSDLATRDFCVMRANEVVGVNLIEDAGNGFLKLNVIVPATSCPTFTGIVYVYAKHFNLV